jgi:ferredoxin
MTHVVTDECVKCKYTDCVEVCPVDCFHEGELMVVINPDTCIDCGVCITECPVQAIKPESDALIDWVEIGRKFSKQWPQITTAKAPLLDADIYKDETNKFEKYVK